MVKSFRLKSVLRNFLNHFQTLESRHKLSIESNDDSIDLYRQEFLTLKELTETLKSDPNCASEEGENDVNRRKNRYKDILPYDHSRVILSEYPGVPGSDYINANYVRGSSGCVRAYIASQGPLPNSVVDFWRMIWETDVTVIIMACNERESGKYKCESYWPQDNDEPQQYGNITVELVKWRQVCPDFLVRTLKVRSDSIERTVCQFHYQTWPDHGVPNSVHPILELVRLMRDVQISETRPILVHCSAGCGRTGTICSIDYVWALLRTGKLRDDFSLYLIIKEMRKQRIAMVQTLEQYVLCYKAVATLFEQQLKMIDSHTYENLDGDGEPLIRPQVLQSNDLINENDDNCKQKIRLKDNKQLISKQNMSSVQNSPSIASDEVRHERLVGRATVIRRPSIAKLKAIFENQNLISTEAPNGRPTSSSFNRTQGFKDNPRNCKSMIENNTSANNSRNELVSHSEQLITNNICDQNIRQQEIMERHNTVNPSDGEQPLYVEFNPSVNQLSHSIENSQTFDSNPIEFFQNNHMNRQQMDSFVIENDQKLLHQNHQKLQQEIRQHIQRKHLQTVQAIHPQMSGNSFAISPQMQNQTVVMHQMGAQMPMAVINQMHTQPLPPPPKPPRTYQYQHMNDGSITSVPNTSEGRLIVSVALPRRPNIELNVSNSSHYEPIGRRTANMSVPNLMSDSLLVNTNSNLENYNNSNNNAIKVLNVSNNNIYESVLPKYRSAHPMEPTIPNGPHNQNIHSYYDLMKLKNQSLNATLPFYDAIYARHGYMTVPNLRHIPVPAIAQIQYPYPQFKPNFEAIYSNSNPNHNSNNSNNINNNNIANNLSKTKSEQNIRKANEKINNNLVNNFNKPENVKNSNQINKKMKNIDKKEGNPNNSVKTNPKLESSKISANSSPISQVPAQESNSGAFSKISNAFKGLRMKPSIKAKNKSNANSANNSAVNVNNGPVVARPPHSHRFSPPTQWTQV